MKLFLILIFCPVLLFQACETTDDTLNSLDHTVPAIEFVPDTLEVAAGGSLTINAVVKDESGIQRIEFSYGDWRINEIVDLIPESYPKSYSFSTQINVPSDAKTQWEEDKFFNDGTSIKIIQRYHKLSLSTWDKNRNLKKDYVYVKVN